MVLEEEIHKLNKLKGLASDEAFNTDWMGSHPSRAFLIALGAGPWNKDRRQTVQREALEWFNDKYHDLIAIPEIHPKVFPLDWQNRFLYDMVASLKKLPTSFALKVREWKETARWERSLGQLFSMCGVGEKGSKVLWMFARDYLKLPSFPIDRHIGRALAEVGLPKNPWYVVELCNIAEVDPNDLNRRLFVAKAENEDWSKDAITVRAEKQSD